MFNAASPATVGRLPPTVSGFSCHFTLDQGAARVGAEGEVDVANEARFAAVLSRCQAESALVVVDRRALEFLVMRWPARSGECRAARASDRRTTGGRPRSRRGRATLRDRRRDVRDRARRPAAVSPAAAAVLARRGRMTFPETDAEEHLGATPKERVRIDKDVTDEQQASDTPRKEQVRAVGAPPP